MYQLADTINTEYVGKSQKISKNLFRFFLALIVTVRFNFFLLFTESLPKPEYRLSLVSAYLAFVHLGSGH